MHERLRSGSDLALGLWESPDAGLPFVHKKPPGGEPGTDDEAVNEVFGRVPDRCSATGIRENPQCDAIKVQAWSQ